LSVGDIRSQIAAEWLQIAQRSQWRAYRKPPSLFLMVPSMTPYDIPFPQNGVPHAPRYAHEHISATGRPMMTPIHFMFGSRVGFSETADLMTLFSVRKIGHSSATGRPVRSTSSLALGWVFVDGGSNGSISGSNKSQMAVNSNFCSRTHRLATLPHITGDDDGDRRWRRQTDATL